MSRLAIASWTLSSLGAVAVVVGVGVVPALGRSAESEVRPPALIESPDCANRLSEGVQDSHRWSPATNGGAMTQTLAVTVPRTTIVRLDASGRVVAALTNTGCAPQAVDDVYLSTVDGALTKTASFDVGRITWVGNFTTPGVYQAQRR